MSDALNKLFNTCKSKSRSLQEVRASCKETLSELLALVNGDLSNDKLVKQFLDDKYKFTDYSALRFLISKKIKEKLGLKENVIVFGNSKSKISLMDVLKVLVKLLECKEKHCSNNDLSCVTDHCGKILTIWLKLAIDLYTKVPCIKGFEEPCKKEMIGFKNDVDILIKSLKEKNKGMDFVELDKKIQILISMMMTN
jgi:hypothetical protein